MLEKHGSTKSNVSSRVESSQVEFGPIFIVAVCSQRMSLTVQEPDHAEFQTDEQACDIESTSAHAH